MLSTTSQVSETIFLSNNKKTTTKQIKKLKDMQNHILL